ncbi:hypothetical protein OF83DRAFT_1174767 [Amylostereum chailletii]|nr:hypothetical protein OF83DRAFT_1174767 [Amylostereum chailletii]
MLLSVILNAGADALNTRRSQRTLASVSPPMVMSPSLNVLNCHITIVLNAGAPITFTSPLSRCMLPSTYTLTPPSLSMPTHSPLSTPITLNAHAPVAPNAHAVINPPTPTPPSSATLTRVAPSTDSLMAPNANALVALTAMCIVLSAYSLVTPQRQRPLCQRPRHPPMSTPSSPATAWQPCPSLATPTRIAPIATPVIPSAHSLVTPPAPTASTCPTA